MLGHVRLYFLEWDGNSFNTLIYKNIPNLYWSQLNSGNQNWSSNIYLRDFLEVNTMKTTLGFGKAILITILYGDGIS